MFEYVTTILQLLLMAFIIYYAFSKLFSMAVELFRDRLVTNLILLECDVIKQKVNGSMPPEHADELLGHTKNIRSHFLESNLSKALEDTVNILKMGHEGRVDVNTAARMLVVLVSFLATQSVVILLIVIAALLASGKEKQKNISYTSKTVSPVIDAVRTIQSSFSGMQPTQI